jgi:hypothetical protein
VEPPGGSISRPREILYREAADIAYYFHWPREEIFVMNSRERRVWLEQITRIHALKKKARDEETWEQFERILASRAGTEGGIL